MDKMQGQQTLAAPISTSPAAATSDETPCHATASWHKLRQLYMPSPRKAYPSLSSIPRTTTKRLAQDAVDGPHGGIDKHTKPDTVFYLAYGSNLSAETFLGVRGIRPLSQVNVSVPTLRLTFDLAGIPYREPCFANVSYRKLPDKPLPDPRQPIVPPIVPPDEGRDGWAAGLIGVVYEVTQSDYKIIMQTEGGGASYHEIAVPCVPLPPRMNVPEKPPIPELPKPFLARTLFAPYIPPGEAPDDPRKRSWWYSLMLSRSRPNPDYAQASARYLKLLTDGAAEHELPDEYQRYLHSLQPYTVTSCRQQIAQYLFTYVLAPLVLALMKASARLADENGNLPKWMAAVLTITFNIVWICYDYICKPLFGDGERTEEEKKKKKKNDAGLRRVRAKEYGTDEEKASILGDFD